MRKKKKLMVLSLTSILILIIFLQSSLARYIYNGVHNFILESQGFYFNSTVLNMNKPTYHIYNWDGVNGYPLNIDVNSKKNERVWTLSDIDYTIEVICPETVTCTVDDDENIIYEASKMDSFIVMVTPKHQIEKGKTVDVVIKATSKSPYKKQLQATYSLGVETVNFSYSIEDSVGSKYLTLKLKNSISFYEVLTPFSNYNVGDTLSLDQYNALSDQNKAKCFSAKVDLTYNSNEIYLDMTDDTYLNAINGTIKTKQYNNFTYISGHSFYVDANSNTEIIFYKKDITKNYTYPIINNTSIIDVDNQTAS